VQMEIISNGSNYFVVSLFSPLPPDRLHSLLRAHAADQQVRGSFHSRVEGGVRSGASMLVD